MPVVIDERCDGCGMCVDECPVGAIELNNIVWVDSDICTDCGSCIDACPNSAITLE
jgi:NAD-dependent dihydropyrimidine dehydrogenase PreA subunit